jgi:hypothetical protein
MTGYPVLGLSTPGPWLQSSPALGMTGYPVLGLSTPGPWLQSSPALGMTGSRACLGIPSEDVAGILIPAPGLIGSAGSAAAAR